MCCCELLNPSNRSTMVNNGQLWKGRVKNATKTGSDESCTCFAVVLLLSCCCSRAAAAVLPLCPCCDCSHCWFDWLLVSWVDRLLVFEGLLLSWVAAVAGVFVAVASALLWCYCIRVNGAVSSFQRGFLLRGDGQPWHVGCPLNGVEAAS